MQNFVAKFGKILGTCKTICRKSNYLFIKFLYKLNSELYMICGRLKCRGIVIGLRQILGIWACGFGYTPNYPISGFQLGKKFFPVRKLIFLS